MSDNDWIVAPIAEDPPHHAKHPAASLERAVLCVSNCLNIITLLLQAWKATRGFPPNHSRYQVLVALCTLCPPKNVLITHLFCIALA